MNDFDQLLPLWLKLSNSGEDYVQATIVEVEGSGYRKPGAHMLIAADGRRAGTISGGCLEAEVARKAMWHTESGTNGTVIRRYSTKAEDGEVPFGMGCGGVVYVLLERRATAEPLFEHMRAAFHERQPLAIATILNGKNAGSRAFWPATRAHSLASDLNKSLLSLAKEGFDGQRSFSAELCTEDPLAWKIHVQFCSARPGLFVFGAGDDAVPLVKLARQLGWYVAVADGRSHLVTKARFPEADDVHVLLPGDFPELPMRSTDAVAIMTHSLEQDTRILTALIEKQLTYIGVLGPRSRTADMLVEIAEKLAVPTSKIPHKAATWLEMLHSPMGLDLGGNTPREIALAAVAEIQQCLHRASGISISKLRATRSESVAELGTKRETALQS